MRQDASTAGMLFPVVDLLAHVSRFVNRIGVLRNPVEAGWSGSPASAPW
jgi:hypothetical protein